MKKLYDKSEILFAILWIVTYTAGMGSLRNLGDDSPYMALGLIVISALMFLFVRKHDLSEKYGLAGWAKNSRAMLWFIPLWILASGNLWGGILPDYQGAGLLFAAVSMALVGFAEELIFRGFLFKAMLKDGNVKAAIIVSSVTFGLGHIVNLLTGHALFETLMQMLLAVAIGFIFTFAFYKSGSLLPCILAHSLIDVLSVFTPDRMDVLDWVYAAVIVILAVAYCLSLNRLETPAVNRPEAKRA